MIDNFLSTEIKYLPGIGARKAKVFNEEAMVFTYEDLLNYYPYKYTDRSKLYKVSEVTSDMANIQIKGKMATFVTSGEKTKERLHAEFFDETGTIELVWFKGIKWVRQQIKPNTEYVIFGKPTEFRNVITMAHPEIEEYEHYKTKKQTPLQPDYFTTEKMKTAFLTSKNICKYLNELFKAMPAKINESLPAYLIAKLELMNLQDAIVNIHFPKDPEQLIKARYRLKFEEFFYNQLSILRHKLNRRNNTRGFVFEKVGDIFNFFYKNCLKFELTNAQKRVLKEIRADLRSGKQANRLLQGDVGSGKTIVALMSMLLAIDNNFQTCIMAPTEILAQQHYLTLIENTEGLLLNIRLLTGSTRTKARREILELLQTGEINILVGTHAIIEEVVQFKNLGLAIIDEQHRFGVAQRSKMWQKNSTPPHVIVMTATPIPRTLAMTIYGDLDISVIDEMPPGRKLVKTLHITENKRLRVFGFLKEQIAKGTQVYIVYPLIKESENMDYKDLEDGLESISRAFPPPEYAISVVHGQMKPEEKEKAMKLFVKGQTQIMIATTVIEVGVNVPNASVMLIESAERFGLSQLHQLRGRVGRGAEQSFCILMTSFKLSKEAKKRLQTMVETNDGFKIAEVDLKLRGPGDIDGTLQSGAGFNFRIANIVKDQAILQHAREVVNNLLDADPEIKKDEHDVILKQFRKLKRTQNIDWAKIS